MHSGCASLLLRSERVTQLIKVQNYQKRKAGEPIMLKKTHFWSSLVSLGLLLGLAQMTVAKTPTSEPTAQIRFRQIEQPQPLKVGIALGGVALIGLELWWFLASKTKAQQE